MQVELALEEEADTKVMVIHTPCMHISTTTGKHPKPTPLSPTHLATPWMLEKSLIHMSLSLGLSVSRRVYPCFENLPGTVWCTGCCPGLHAWVLFLCL